MNYCSIEDAWKNSDSLTDQFKFKKKTIENFSSDNNISTSIKIDNEEYYNKNNFDYNKGNFDYNKDNFDYNKDNFDYNKDNFDYNKDNFDYNKDNFDYYKDNFDYTKDNFEFKIDNDFVNDINNNIKKKSNINNHLIKQNNLNTDTTNNTNNYQNVFICDDFLDHLETCKICRMKMRNRFGSNIVEKFDNLIVDNKDTVLLFLLILFALIFCNLVIAIFK